MAVRCRGMPPRTAACGCRTALRRSCSTRRASGCGDHFPGKRNARRVFPRCVAGAERGRRRCCSGSVPRRWRATRPRLPRRSTRRRSGQAGSARGRLQRRRCASGERRISSTATSCAEKALDKARSGEAKAQEQSSRPCKAADAGALDIGKADTTSQRSQPHPQTERLKSSADEISPPQKGIASAQTDEAKARGKEAKAAAKATEIAPNSTPPKPMRRRKPMRRPRQRMPPRRP